MTFQHIRSSIPLPAPVFDARDVPDVWLSLPKTPRSARAQGLPWYFCGQCRTCGAFAVRRAYSPACPHCAREKAREKRILTLGPRDPITTIGE